MTSSVLLLVILAPLTIGALLVVYGTVVKNRWGINLGDVNCPRCGAHYLVTTGDLSE